MNLYHRTYAATAIIRDGFRLAITEDEPAEAVMFWLTEPALPRGSWSTRSASIGFVLSGIGSGKQQSPSRISGGMMLVPRQCVRRVA